MAQDGQDTNRVENGVFTTGQYAGQKVEDVMKYLNSLETALDNSGQPPTRPQTPPARKTGEQALEEHASERVDPALAMTWARLEADDEAKARGAINDYDEYKEEIDRTKKTLAPAIRIQPGIHERLYLNIKLERNAEARQSVYGKRVAAPPLEPPDGETDEERETREAEEAAAAETKRAADEAAAAEAAKKKTPKPAPPSQPPTPANRSNVPARRASTPPPIKLTDKMKNFTSAMGLSEENAVKALTDRGATQSDIDEVSKSREQRRQDRGGPSSIYDRIK